MSNGHSNLRKVYQWHHKKLKIKFSKFYLNNKYSPTGTCPITGSHKFNLFSTTPHDFQGNASKLDKDINNSYKHGASCNNSNSPDLLMCSLIKDEAGFRPKYSVRDE